LMHPRIKFESADKSRSVPKSFGGRRTFLTFWVSPELALFSFAEYLAASATADPSFGGSYKDEGEENPP